MRRILILCIAGCLMFQSSGGFCDVIYLKNDQKIEGTVVKETDKVVVIDIGAGQFTFDQKEVELVERNDSAPAVTAADGDTEKQELNRLFAILNKKRSVLVRYKQDQQQNEKAAKKIKAEILPLYKRYDELLALDREYEKQRRGRLVTVADRKKIHTMVQQMNQVASGIKELELRYDALADERRQIDRKLSENLREFIFGLEKLRTQYDAVIANSNSKKLRDKLSYIKKRIETFDSSWLRQRVPVRREGNSFVVDVVLNGKVRASLIIDTGAEMVCISRAIADKLGITADDEVRTVTGRLADGSEVAGRMIILPTVDIQGMHSENVDTIVFADSPSSNADGLLGMSYLGNYFFRLNTRSKELELEQFEI